MRSRFSVLTVSSATCVSVIVWKSFISMLASQTRPSHSVSPFFIICSHNPTPSDIVNTNSLNWISWQELFIVRIKKSCMKRLAWARLLVKFISSLSGLTLLARHFSYCEEESWWLRLRSLVLCFIHLNGEMSVTGLWWEPHQGPDILPQPYYLPTGEKKKTHKKKNFNNFVSFLFILQTSNFVFLIYILLICSWGGERRLIQFSVRIVCTESWTFDVMPLVENNSTRLGSSVCPREILYFTFSLLHLSQRNKDKGIAE